MPVSRLVGDEEDELIADGHGDEDVSALARLPRVATADERPQGPHAERADELQALAVTQGHAFGIFRSDDDVEERAELLAHVTCRGAFVDGRMVGTAVDWTPRLSLPGGPQLTTVALR